MLFEIRSAIFTARQHALTILSGNSRHLEPRGMPVVDAFSCPSTLLIESAKREISAAPALPLDRQRERAKLLMVDFDLGVVAGADGFELRSEVCGDEDEGLVFFRPGTMYAHLSGVGELAVGDGAQMRNLGVLLLEKRGQLFLNEAVEFVEHVSGESVAALHDNLVAAD
ncbi:MAG: hypothetical protein JO365_14335, partial [Bradyrhizobium sp.]|nr:hypothetical protein [Acidobacteriota bacterium]MBV9981152.1 hypothetical protein [Bradyrhizobium sp.]